MELPELSKLQARGPKRVSSASRTSLRALQRTGCSLAKYALAFLLLKADALSFSKPPHTSPANDACASSTDSVLGQTIVREPSRLLPHTRDHRRVRTAESFFLRKNFPTMSSAICLACANPRNQLVPLRRAQVAKFRSAQHACQADSCTLVEKLLACYVVKCPTLFERQLRLRENSGVLRCL